MGFVLTLVTWLRLHHARFNALRYFFAMHWHFFRGVNSDPYLRAINTEDVRVMSSSMMMLSPTFRVKISMFHFLVLVGFHCTRLQVQK